MPLYSVRGVIKFDEVYEERIVVFDALDFEHALEQARVEAADYVAALGSGIVLDLQQAYELDTVRLAPGVELFSLMRTSELDTEEYLGWYFSGGGEHQQL